MNQTSMPSAPDITPPAPARDLAPLLAQIAGCSRDDKKLLLYHLLQDIYGDRPEGEWSVRNPDGSTYLHVIGPEARAMLFCTPERVALWKSQDRSKSHPFRETVEMLERGDEEEIRAFLNRNKS